jgi:hypothetical protein
MVQGSYAQAPDTPFADSGGMIGRVLGCGIAWWFGERSMLGNNCGERTDVEGSSKRFRLARSF